MASSIASKSSSSFASWRRRLASRIRRSSANSDLTESSLNEHNRRNEAKTDPSPYYKGLTDSTLSINRLKNAKRSPGRESYSTTATASTLSSFFIKAGKLRSSCFRGRSEQNHNVNAFEQRIPPPVPPPPPPRPSLHRRSVSPSLMKSEMEVGGGSRASKNGGERSRLEEGKPTRERIVAGLKTPVEEREPNGSQELMVKEEEKKFVWADKYRPKGLKNFICNRDKAQLLQDIVRVSNSNSTVGL